MLAQSYATLEHMTNSRVILGLGAGELVNTQPYGLRYEKTVSRLEEAVQVIKLLWGSRTDELINYNGKFFKLENAIFGLPPLQHRPQIWIGGNGERMCRIAADHADGWLPYYLTTEEYKEKLKIVRDECSRIGRDFEQIEKAIILRLIIDTNREECSRIMETPLVKALALDFPADLYRNLGYRHPLGEDFHSLTDYIPSKYTRDEITHAIEQIPSEVVKQSYVWGNIEDVVDKLDEYRKAGVQTVVLFNCTFLGDLTKLLSSYSCIDELVSNFKER
jgi:phthiodiolone/phenolphthiodiolone dimycocerosates ketoreductase